MKKTLIALAVLGATAGVAQAQSQVTIYGVLAPSYDYVSVKDAPGAASVKTTSMQSNASRIGFMGSEDLGGGLKATFKLESEFNPVDDSGFTTGNHARDTYVGLKGAFGEVQFGNINTVYKQISASYDPMEDTIGDYNAIMGMSPNFGEFHTNRRDRQAVNYYSPVFSGFQVSANYSLSTNENKTAGQADNALDTTAYGLAAVYNNGPLNVLAAYDHANNVRGSGLDDKFWKVGAAYTFPSNTSVRAIYEKAKVGSLSAAHWLVGAEQKFGAATLMANYINAGDWNGSDTGASAYNIGVKYDLSKRTSVMGVYAYFKNDAKGGYTTDGEQTGDSDAANAGSKMTGFSVRLKHQF